MGSLWGYKKQVEMDEIIEIKIDSLVYGGNGLGRLEDGRAAFVPFCLPGEKVQARIVESKRGHVKAELIKVITPSPERIEPRCRHFGVCGGCHYQHIEYSDQLKYKQKIIVEQLQRLAGIANPVVKQVFASPTVWNYRNTVQFHPTENGAMGYQKAGSNKVIKIEECLLPMQELFEVWPNITIDPESKINRIDLRIGINNEILLTLESEEVLPEEFEVDFPISVVHIGPEGPFLLAGNDHVVLQVMNRYFKVSAGAFFQVNTPQAEGMVQYLFDELPLSENTTVLDLYCGVGLFSAFLAPKVKHLIGIEVSDAACDDFAANLDEFENVELYMGEVDSIIPGLQTSADIVVLDPPRSGLAPSVVDALCRMKPGIIAYISCDPATLARDIRKLSDGGFKLKSVAPFDLFPQTFHIEAIALLERMNA